MVVRYQVDEFTNTWSAEHLIAQLYIYPGFIGKVCTLTHFPLKPGCEDYTFLDQTMADFEHGLDSILTHSVCMLQLDISLDEADTIHFSVSSVFLHSASTVSYSSRLQLAPNIKCYKL